VSDVLTIDQLGAAGSGLARYGVLGHPVTHSLSPQMQMAAFAAAGIEARYDRIEVLPDGLPSAVAALKSAGFRGWNCTLPHKIGMAALCDVQQESARVLGGVNTVRVEEGKLVGFNTDGEGWVRAVREEFSMDVRDLRILILGTGGAGRALALQAAMERCERLVLVNRTEARARELLPLLEPHFQSDRLQGAQGRLSVIPWEEKRIAMELDTIDLVVNCTSQGLKVEEPSVLPARVFQPHLMVYDTIYRPACTRLLEAARQSGARTANGLSMLLHQGALSWEIWNDRPAPLEAMRKALREAAGA
jgi:shikimate dehydrogenase